MERATKNAIEILGKKDILFIFPSLLSNTSTRLVLKKPKTESSIRKVWLPKTDYILDADHFHGVAFQAREQKELER